MVNPIKIAIFAARYLRTSTGSMNTVLNLLDNLDQTKYQISLILIDDLVSFDSKISQEELEKDPVYMPFEKIEQDQRISAIYNIKDLTLGQIQDRFDFAIVAIYNTFGEDGRLIGLLETVGIPYLSPGLITSSLCMNKALTKEVLRANGLPVAKDLIVDKINYKFNKTSDLLDKDLGYPVVVKPVSTGASRGTSLVHTREELEKAINDAFRFSDQVMIEDYIPGQEFTVGVIGSHLSPVALPVVMIKPQSGFFDYKAKYVAGGSEEICPAPISAELTSRLQQMAINAYRAVIAKSHSRIDIIVNEQEIIVLEINTFPGLTSSSLFPRELKEFNYPLNKFLDDNISNALKSRSKS